MLAHRNRQALLQEGGLGGHEPIGFMEELEPAEARG
jgi:hypothetical protein